MMAVQKGGAKTGDNEISNESGPHDRPIVKCPYCSHEGDDFKMLTGFRPAYICPSCDSTFYDFMATNLDLPEIKIGMSVQAKDNAKPSWVQCEIGEVIQVRDDSIVADFKQYGIYRMWPDEYIVLKGEKTDA